MPKREKSGPGHPDGDKGHPDDPWKGPKPDDETGVVRPKEPKGDFVARRQWRDQASQVPLSGKRADVVKLQRAKPEKREK